MKYILLVFFFLGLFCSSCQKEPQVSIIKNEKFKLRQAIDFGDFVPLGVAKYNQYVFISDTTESVVLRYDTETAIIDTICNDRIGYINCEKSRLTMPAFEVDSIYVYRGSPKLYSLNVGEKLVRPTGFSGRRIDDYLIVDQARNVVIRNSQGKYSLIGAVSSSF